MKEVEQFLSGEMNKIKIEKDCSAWDAKPNTGSITLGKNNKHSKQKAMILQDCVRDYRNKIFDK